MSGSHDHDHGVSVEVDSLYAALQPTRALRQALDVLSANLPTDMETDANRAALHDIDELLRETELAALRRYGLARDYVVIKPISPLNPPDPEDMGKVAAAIRTLDDLGLIITL